MCQSLVDRGADFLGDRLERFVVVSFGLLEAQRQKVEHEPYRLLDVGVQAVCIRNADDKIVHREVFEEEDSEDAEEEVESRDLVSSALRFDLANCAGVEIELHLVIVVVV